MKIICNHDASINDSKHSKYRRPIDTEVSAILSLHGSGVTPRNLVASLLEQTHTLVTSREVYKVIAKVKKERLQLNRGSDPEQLWAFEYTTDDNGHVNFLFIVPYSQIDLAQQFPDITFIDATYRTNRFNMPLIHFMVVASYRKTVNVAMCFVASEEDAMYNHAINAFKTLVMGDAKIEVFTDDNSLKAALSLYNPDTTQLLYGMSIRTWKRR
jgi:SWIM-type zinc finger protein